MNIIFARSANWMFGNKGTLPWGVPLKEDMQWFKAMTTGCTVIMGRKTYESIGRPLINRNNIVVSSTRVDTPGVYTAKNITHAEDIVFLDIGSDLSKVFVTGGAKLIEEYFEYAGTVYVSNIDRICEGDVQAPIIPQEFKLTGNLPLCKEVSISIYRRI